MLCFAIAPRVGLSDAAGESLRLIHDPESLAVGVGSDNPDAVTLMRGTDVSRSKHTPLRIIPHRGKVTEDSGKSSTNKQR
jgi:hypothetical protein